MDREVIEALRQLEREKGLEFKTVLEALKAALISAYRRYYHEETDIKIDINEETGRVKVFSKKEEEKDGKKVVKEVEVTPEDFGRIAAQTAKQVILQKIREAEREKLYFEYAGKEGELVTGIIQQTDRRFTLLDLGRAEALLPPHEQVPGERYEHGSRLKAYIVEVRKTSREPQIVVSRTHPGLVKRLFELEVPEIQQGIVEIKSVAREPGHRTKIAVHSRDKNVDPVGACVGPKGSRVKMVVRELRGEKIDVIEWVDDPAQFIAHALSPAKVKEVSVNEKEKEAEVIVPDDQLSLAIGKEGQNARLAAKLTGWRIDIKSESEKKQEEEEEKKKAATKGKERVQCEALTTSGKQCRNKAVEGEKYCSIHLSKAKG
jgi:N utilization substance protein A